MQTTPTAIADLPAPIAGYFAHEAGNFPGSPVELRYRFTLVDGQIARLEIAP